MALFLFPAFWHQSRSFLRSFCFFVYLNQFHAVTAAKERSVSMKQCQDGYYDNFRNLPDMLNYFEMQHKASVWKNCAVPQLRVVPLDTATPANRGEYAVGVSDDAIADTADNIGLAAAIKDPSTNLGAYYPIRDTAYKSLLDRAKINGTVLPKLSREVLANTLNECLAVHTKSNALVLIRDEKINAFHSGDIADYSVLPVPELLNALVISINKRFEDAKFINGYTDHSICIAEFTFPAQREEIMERYEKALVTPSQKALAEKLVPGIFFATSDTGVSSARISARLTGLKHPIPIGEVLSVDHRNNSKVSDFKDQLDMVFSKFHDTVDQLTKLLGITLTNPVNAMTGVCKRLSLPKKPALEAINMFGVTNGTNPASAHDVFFALQEILFLLKIADYPQSKIFSVEETLTRALTINWKRFDVPGTVSY